MQPTHINAYQVELEEAIKDEARAHSRVEQLRETIDTMKQAEGAVAEEEQVTLPQEPEASEMDDNSGVGEAETVAEEATPVDEPAAESTGKVGTSEPVEQPAP